MHELITELIAESNEQDSDTKNNEGLEQDDESTMSVNSTAAKSIEPGDIRKLMSTPCNSAINPPNKKVSFKSEIAIDRETCRKVNACATYQLSQTNRSSPYSLVDRGANSGVAGNNARVIKKHLDKTCNIKGVDDHEVPSIPIFKAITGHEDPLPKSYSNCDGLPCNLRIEWENGKITNEPLNIIAADDPVSCAIYGGDYDLLQLPG